MCLSVSLKLTGWWPAQVPWRRGVHLIDAPDSGLLVGDDREFLAWLKSDDATGCYCDDLTSFRIASRARALVTQLKIPEPCQLDRFTTHQCIADFSEKGIDHFLCFALIQ